MNPTFYPSAAQNQIAVVEHRRLSGRHRALRLVELHFHMVRNGCRMKRRRGGFVLVPDLHLRAHRSRKAGPRDPVDVLRDQPCAQ